MIKKVLTLAVEKLVSMDGFEMEEYILSILNAKATEKNTSGIDGIMTVNGKTVKVEVKNHGLNRASLGRINLDMTIQENIKNLLKSDLYVNVRPQTATMEIMTKKEMFNWLMDERVVLDKDRHGNYKFKINFYPRTKKQDLKLKNVGLI